MSNTLKFPSQLVTFLFLSADSASLLTSDLNEVASVIVNRAWEDPTYHNAAANLCAYIAQARRSCG